MPGDEFGAAVNFDPINIGFDQNLPVTVGYRYRVVVPSVANQRERT
jgi:hypothetical protein